jgi:serine/threonine protein kinase
LCSYYLSQSHGQDFINFPLYRQGDVYARYCETLTLAITEPTARRLMRDVATGLREMHEAGIFHRDLKPQNILIRDDGGFVIADLGMAFDRHHTPNPFRPGTFAFAAPEVLEGTIPSTSKSEVWGLGMSVACLVDDSPPYDFPPSDHAQNNDANALIARQFIAQKGWRC